MTRLLRTLFLCLLACAGTAAFANCGHSGGSDYCGPEPLSLVYVTASGLVYIKPTTPLSPAPIGFACTPVSGSYFVLNPNAANFKPLYAALLTARASGAPVTLVADPAQPQCTILYVTL